MLGLSFRAHSVTCNTIQCLTVRYTKRTNLTEYVVRTPYPEHGCWGFFLAMCVLQAFPGFHPLTIFRTKHRIVNHFCVGARTTWWAWVAVVDNQFPMPSFSFMMSPANREYLSTLHNLERKMIYGSFFVWEEHHRQWVPRLSMSTYLVTT